MKSSVSIALLLLYVAYLFKGLFPYIEYELNYEYISEELCINLEDDLSACKGKCYLNSQIKLFVGDQNSEQGAPLESRAEVKVNSHTLANSIKLSLNSDCIESEFLIVDTHLRNNVILELETPPPKQLG